MEKLTAMCFMNSSSHRKGSTSYSNYKLQVSQPTQLAGTAKV
ncbi:MAG: hypothetical protein ACSHWW_09295 [Nonlabens sp.]